MARPVLRHGPGSHPPGLDHLAEEEPLELRLVQGGEEQTLSVTLRTPGADRELALGWLHAEGWIGRADDVLGLEPWRQGELGNPNVWRVELRPGLLPPGALPRRTVTSSACGVCGAGSLERLAVRAVPAVWSGPPLSPGVVLGLAAALRAAQPGFGLSGGLHAAGLFTARGECLAAYEDVGRHNAVDKLIGWALTHGRLPLSDHLLAVSSRAGFEIVQKAALAGIPVVCALSAPTSLAADVAAGLGLTLIAFVREGRFNVYSGETRVAGSD